MMAITRRRVLNLIGQSESLRQPRSAHFDNIHASNKPIPVSSDRFDQFLAAFAFAKELAEVINTLFEIVFFDDSVRPDMLEEFIFGNEVPPLPQEENKRPKGFVGERAKSVSVNALDRMLVNVESKITKFVYLLFPHCLAFAIKE